MLSLEEAERRLHDLMYGRDKWYYAFAMGHGCTTELNDEISIAVRRADAELRAVIAEHKSLL